jgi:ribonuclease BN (tRNA processing enzyme)
MRLQFIGVGAAIKTTHHGASAVVNGHILIDTPPACNALLRRYALLVDTIFITHLHGDHLGGLPFLLLEKYVDNNMKTLHIYGPDGLEEKIRLYFEAMFSELDVVKYPIFDSVRFHVVEPEVEIELCGLSVKPVLGRHAITSFGYVFRDDHVCVYFSGDTELCEPVLEAIDEAHCMVIEGTKKSGKLATHMTVEELLPIVRSYPEKMFYITHRQDYDASDISEHNLFFPEEGESCDVEHVKVNFHA